MSLSVLLTPQSQNEANFSVQRGVIKRGVIKHGVLNDFYSFHMKRDVREISGMTQCWKAFLLKNGVQMSKYERIFNFKPCVYLAYFRSYDHLKIVKCIGMY